MSTSKQPPPESTNNSAFTQVNESVASNSSGSTAQPKFPVVAIGASAGGLQALNQFFAAIAEDADLAYVVVVHLSPDFKSHLAEILQKTCPIPVIQVTESIGIQKNHVYVIPPNANINSVDTHLRLSKLEEKPGHRAPIDHFFRTLAMTNDGLSVAVILTGTGSDGTLGMKEVKATGGLCIVQDPNEAEFNEMPQNAISNGLPDMILPVAQIPAAILQFAHTKPKVPKLEDEQELEGEAQQLLQKIFVHLDSQTGRDFSRYKRSTIMRRIQRRMQLNHIESLKDYLNLLRREISEVQTLANDLLITVTNFFRDPEVFDYLSAQVLPQLFEAKNNSDDLRVWSVGCATGEEAYSLAILLLEAAAHYERSPRMQIFASDLHEHSIIRARDGLYTHDIEADISPERMERFFVKEHGHYRIKKEVREMVVFAPHNLMRDPPFSRIDLICCRNVLIYLQRSAQRDVIELFHYAMRPSGFLILGTAETVDSSDLFRLQDKRACAYRKSNVGGAELRLPNLALAKATRGSITSDVEPREETNSYQSLHLQMLQRFGQPSLLVNPDDKIVHLSENAGRYLIHPEGEPTTNLFKLVRSEMRLEMRSGVQEARSLSLAKTSKPINVSIDGNIVAVSLKFFPTRSQKEKDFVLVIFEEQIVTDASKRNLSVVDSNHSKENLLEAELQLIQQHLQATIEENETTQEEMKAANEELQSTNEELRSTMEELETSKEELQSMNEELQTVNQENRHRVEELSQLSSDLNNLFAATNIATLFLDRDLRILRLTPTIHELFNVKMSDRGRLISDFTNRFRDQNLIEDARKVISKLVPIERELKDTAGNWYLTRLLPYRSDEDRIEGVVINFIDITDRRVTEQRLRESEEKMRVLVEASSQAVWETDARGIVTVDSPSWRIYTGQKLDEWLGNDWINAVHPDDRVRAEGQWQEAILGGRMIDSEFRLRAPDGSYRWTYIRAAPLRDEDGEIHKWVGMNVDVTERKRAVEKLSDLNRSLEQQVADRNSTVENRSAALKKLAAELTKTEHRERKRLAHLLHDDLQQQLVGVRLMLSGFAQLSEDAQIAQMERLDARLKDCLSLTRNLTKELSPPILLQSSLRESILWLANYLQEMNDLHVKVAIASELPDVPEAIHVFFFYTIKELVLNALKHSGQKEVSIQLQHDEDYIVAQVEDRGTNFNKDEVETGLQQPKAFGLFQIRERLEALGGNMRLEKSETGGACIQVLVPLHL